MSESLKFTPDDFDLPNAVPIGTGAMSNVLRAVHTASGRVVAVKVLSKVQLLQMNKVEGVMLEKEALYALGPHPFIVRLYGTAQSEDELYFILEHLPNGDLLEHVRNVAADRAKLRAERLERGEADPPHEPRCLDFSDIQLIVAQIVDALGHCFSKGYCLRDLKPENLCFDEAFRCCLIDFDTVDKGEGGVVATPVSNHGQAVKPAPQASERRRLTVSQINSMRRNTAKFCGTAQYVSPEMVGECKWSFSSDLWALGVICYHCAYGRHPFEGGNSFDVMRQLIRGIDDGHFTNEVDFGSCESLGVSNFFRLKRFIMDLLRVNPVDRLGVHPVTRQFDADQVRRHSFFSGFDWGIIDRERERYRFVPPAEFLKQGVRGNSVRSEQDKVVDGMFQVAVAEVSLQQWKEDVAERRRRSLEPLPPPPLGAAHGIARHYKRLPQHSDAYSEYVFAATAEANPFEAWIRKAEELSNSNGGQKNALIGDALVEENILRNTSGADSSDKERQDSSSSDEDDVIDDVGVMQGFNAVDPDFH